MKRNDLQCLRALAILAVLLFHLFPKFAPNGYFGVDLFFVLSGFLMALVYSMKISFASAVQFYYRRVKRIVPLYVFSILISWLPIFYLLPTSFRSVNRESALNALLLITNFANKDESNRYFIALQEASDSFTHTWSIAVEMQFYLFVPPLFALLSVRDKIAFKCGILVTLSTVSYASRYATDAFNNPLCRLWQFCIGMIAFIIGNSFGAASTAVGSKMMTLEVESQTERAMLLPREEIGLRSISQPISSSISKSISKLASIAAIACLFCPFELTPHWAQAGVTILAGVAMAFGPHPQSMLMENRVLVYIGDISYALYLVHWPIYCILKNNRHFIVDDYGLMTAMLLTILFAAFIHETFEKFYLKMGRLPVVVLIAVLYLLTASVLVRESEILSLRFNQTYGEKNQNWTAIYGIGKNGTTIKSVNAMFDQQGIMFTKNDCFPAESNSGSCEVENAEFGRKGKYSILIMGNSYAVNAKDLVVRHFAPFARSIKLRTIPYCNPITYYTNSWCDTESAEKFMNWLTDVKPDILFIIARHFFHREDKMKGEITKDPTFLSALNGIWKIESFVQKRVYLLDSFMYAKRRFAELDTKIESGEEINPDDFTVARDVHESIHRRLVEISKRCKKCVLYSYMPHLTDAKSGKPILIEPKSKLRLYESIAHLTPIGVAYVDPAYRQLAEQLEADIKNNTV